jgi:hypothetical protein
MKSAGKKWRDFKNSLKKKYFKDNLSVEENIATGCGARIPRDEWEWLVKYWSEERTKVPLFLTSSTMLYFFKNVVLVK